MNLCSISTIKNLCDEIGLTPQKSKGQSFLVDQNVLDKIICFADLKKDDVVVEVGSGFGVLTAELSKKASKVIAIELDNRLYSFLKSQNIPNVDLINEDILKFNLKSYLEKQNIKNYKVVANFPYSITSKLFRYFLSECGIRPSEMTVMIQREVAQRICAKKGQHSILSLSIQFYAKPKIVFEVSSNSFWPTPAVDSAVLKFVVKPDIIEEKYKSVEDFEKKFFKLVKVGFSQKRKQLRKNLTNSFHIDNDEIKLILKKVKLKETARAQELGLDDWKKLVYVFDGLGIF